MKSVPKEFGNEVIKILTSDNGINNFGFVNDKWRENIYREVNSSLKNIGCQIIYIIQSPYKDIVKIIRDKSDLVINMHFNGEGFFTSVISTYYSNIEIWEDFKGILNDLKG